jgi:hypothetical protein
MDKSLNIKEIMLVELKTLQQEIDQADFSLMDRTDILEYFTKVNNKRINLITELLITLI